MKEYLVFTFNLALAPLTGEDPRGGKLAQFDELDEARQFAEQQKGDWDRVFILQRSEEGELERIEYYQRGRKYIGNQRIRSD